VLAKATHLAQEARLMIERIRFQKGAKSEYVMPDISTKEKALEFVKPYIDAQKAKEKAKEAAQKITALPTGGTSATGGKRP
jgi:formate-dependent nitrite reductase cytochrome c552 subunit